jgi:ubiquinone/menaquinone biosynthesis C-methylase UbiE
MSSYDLFAQFYDMEHKDFCRDIELYRNYAVRCGGPVLELGCGSGRVSLALAKAGFNVMGVDNSATMLALARARITDAGLGERIQLQQADVRALKFEARFALVLFPLNGFLHLTTVEDQLSALAGAHRALLPGGLLIVDLPNPHTTFTPSIDGQFILRSHFASPESRPISSYASAQTDLASQMQRLTLFYDEVSSDGTVRRTTVTTALRFVYRYEMDGLLRRVGFEVDGVYGSYDLESYESDSEIMLFVAHKLGTP